MAVGKNKHLTKGGKKGGTLDADLAQPQNRYLLHAYMTIIYYNTYIYGVYNMYMYVVYTYLSYEYLLIPGVMPWESGESSSGGARGW